MTDPQGFTPLHKSVTVPWTPAAAFRRFTDEISRWWPYRTHSVGTRDVDRIVFEGRVGGEIYELHKGGAKHVWGKVKEWQPPHRVAFTWHPGQDPTTFQDIEVTFTAVDGGTRLNLVHTGWERMGKLAKTARRGYPIGWTYVLRIYAGRAKSPLVIGIAALTWVIGTVQVLLKKARPDVARPRDSRA